MYKVCSRGLLDSNSYIYWNENDSAEIHEAVVIDAGCRTDDILTEVKKNNLKIKYIILTHAHADHACFLEEIRSLAPGAKCVCHVLEEPAFYDDRANVSALLGMSMVYSKPELKVVGGDFVEVGGKKVEFIHTPGHTPGGMCIYIADEKIMFTGDTLFCNGFGRTDLGGNASDLKASIAKLYEMDEGIVILPGHGCSSTIGEESAWGVPAIF